MRSQQFGRTKAGLRLLACLSGLLLLTSTPSYAKKSVLTPAKVRQAKKDRQSYEACRKDALAQAKRRGLGKGPLEAALTTCKENFPGASLYIECKKSAIKTARSKANSEEIPNAAARLGMTTDATLRHAQRPEAASGTSGKTDATLRHAQRPEAASGTSGKTEAAADQCKRFLTATGFDPAGELPFFAESGQLYFAGIGLNRVQTVNRLTPPNFDCDAVKATTKDLAAAQYLLFGNHPRVFANLANKQGAALMTLLQIKKPSKDGVDVPGLGRVFGDPKTKNATTYFPTGACDFDADTGDVYSGLSTYYLINQAARTATPYFGIAYYKAEQQTVTTARLIKDLTRTLGGKYQPFAKNRQVTFIAETAVTETDDEQDPKNLCRTPRQHQFFAVVQARKDSPSQPEYALVANIKNLCDFGDRLAQDLVD